MTNQTLLQQGPLGQAQTGAASNLKSLAQALDQLVADKTSYLYLTLPEQTVAEIQKNFTINKAASAKATSGITGDARP